MDLLRHDEKALAQSEEYMNFKSSPSVKSSPIWIGMVYATNNIG